MQNANQQTPNAPDNAIAWRLPEAARRIGTSRRFLEQQIKAGNLRVLRLSPRCVRVRPEDLSAWMERRAV